MAALAGQFIGLIIGGILAVFNWRYVFLITVPFGMIGTIWAFLKLKEPVYQKRSQKIDVWGNLSFIGGLTLFLVGIIYALIPYGSSPMGWGDPFVIAALLAGIILLVSFPHNRDKSRRSNVPSGSFQDPQLCLRKRGRFSRPLPVAA